jgi:hypothetical protein
MLETQKTINLARPSPLTKQYKEKRRKNDFQGHRGKCLARKVRANDSNGSKIFNDKHVKREAACKSYKNAVIWKSRE